MTKIGVTDRNVPVGQDHPQADLTDREVERMRDLREREGWSIQRLADAFEVSYSLAAMICRYEKRVARPSAWRKVHGSEGKRAIIPGP